MTEHIAARNLDFAHQARRWVRHRLGFSPGNTFEHASGFGAAGVAVLVGRWFQDGSNSYDDLIQKRVGLTEKLGHGNCGELSAVALQYLKPKVRPVAIVGVNFPPILGFDSNHGFVVIGRNATAVDRDIRKWNPECAICDPWMDKAYLVREIEAKMPQALLHLGVWIEGEYR